MIDIKNISKKYKNIIALDNISIKIPKNQIIGILGQNGAGKTTLMDIICACRVADSGTVAIDNIMINESPDRYKSMVSYMPEQVPLYKDLTVLEYLKFVAELKKIYKRDIHNHLHEIMQVCNIDNVQNRLINNLSKGYKQRVGIAQALVGNADILVLDEPTVGLDPKQIVEILLLIKNLGKSHSILLSTHRIDEIQSVCDEYIILHKGKIRHRASINNNSSNDYKIEIIIDTSNSENALLDIANLSFVRKLDKPEHIFQYGTDLLRISVYTSGELLPEKAISTILFTYSTCIYKIARVSEDIEKTFLEITKE